MNRRQFLKTAAITPVAVILGNKFVATLRPFPLHEMQARLKALQPQRLVSTGSWNVSQLLQHCSQSIRYSVQGYPKAHAVLRQNLVGKLQLNAYAAFGRLPNTEPVVIPGAPALEANVPNDVALQELLYELQQFITWQGALAPHFAYGSLTKAQYYAVHYLHLDQHLAQIRQQ